MPKKQRKTKEAHDPRELLNASKKLMGIKSNAAFAKELGLPVTTVQNWSEGKGSTIVIRFLELCIKNHQLSAKNDALLLLLRDIEPYDSREGK